MGFKGWGLGRAAAGCRAAAGVVCFNGRTILRMSSSPLIACISSSMPATRPCTPPPSPACPPTRPLPSHAPPPPGLGSALVPRGTAGALVCERRGVVISTEAFRLASESIPNVCRKLSSTISRSWGGASEARRDGLSPPKELPDGGACLGARRKDGGDREGVNAEGGSGKEGGVTGGRGWGGRGWGADGGARRWVVRGGGGSRGRGEGPARRGGERSSPCGGCMAARVLAAWAVWKEGLVGELGSPCVSSASPVLHGGGSDGGRLCLSRGRGGR